MSVWWLILIVPAAMYAGTFLTAWMAGRAYDRGFDKGYFEGWTHGREYP